MSAREVIAKWMPTPTSPHPYATRWEAADAILSALSEEGFTVARLERGPGIAFLIRANETGEESVTDDFEAWLTRDLEEVANARAQGFFVRPMWTYVEVPPPEEPSVAPPVSREAQKK